MPQTLWHHTPASEFKEGYPLGNGILGAMVLGGVPVERIGLNHEWLWRAGNRDRDFEPRNQHLEEIRRLFFEGKTFEAGEMANEKLGGGGGIAKNEIPNRVDPYQPAGDLYIETDHQDLTDYRRELEMERAVATVSYACEGVTYRRETFAHASRSLVVMRMTASRSGALSAMVRLDRIADPECVLEMSIEGSRIVLRGAFPEGVRFAIVADVRVEGGEIVSGTSGAALRVEGTDAFEVRIAMAVDWQGADAAPKAFATLDDTALEVAALLEEHALRFSEVFNRVALEIDAGGDRSQPVEERLKTLHRRYHGDNDLLAQYFHFGRYLLISSALMGDLPPNLQGIWNEELRPPWEADFHLDVNLEMNYWPAEVCDLPETTEPLFRFMERVAPHGREMAKAIYGCDGVYFPLTTDAACRATPEARGYDVWVGAAAWLAQHMWWRWEYGGDREFLRGRCYPFLREVAAFYEDYLVRDPQGRLAPVPSQSPENAFHGGTRPVSLCVGAAMDLELIRDTLEHAIAAAEALDEDADRREKWRETLDGLMPLQVGRQGQLMEWGEDYPENEPGHRHFSHLYGLYPSDLITPEETPELATAARISLLRRLASDGGHTGWSRAWTVALLARLGEGDMALTHLRHLVADFATVSLLDLHPPRIFQIDGNLGGTAAVAELLMQSHRGTIRLLPSLPGEWRAGRFSGLVARGGFVVSVEWRDGALTQATILSRRGGPCRVSCGNVTLEIMTRPGEETQLSIADFTR